MDLVSAYERLKRYGDEPPRLVLIERQPLYLHEREVLHRGKELIKCLCVFNGNIPDIKVRPT